MTPPAAGVAMGIGIVRPCEGRMPQDRSPNRWSLVAFALVVAAVAGPAFAQPKPAAPARTLRVLFVGNSLVYVNDLPATLRALAASQPAPIAIETQTFVAPGGTVAERWKDGRVSKALAEGHWDALVLQERGGLLACMVDTEQRTSSECRASERAHKDFAAQAKAAGARTFVLATWGPDAAWQTKLDRAAKQLAGRIDAQVVPAGPALRAYAAKHGEAATFPDTIHPSLPATLIMAVQLHRAIVGNAPVPADVTLDFALLPARAAVTPDAPMETQPQLKGDGKKMVVKADAMALLIAASQP
ncbi:hypothetical protein LVB87_01935 [Lysobacter sp. KIS68-7]|uniref:hypothetical protein n=1 Tax=Lysobacter sp. KIS68-7 TaxID=2904252 RepID=UPI001E56AFE1|nr:hypothetical protein [Lysobacter sp. KIS68-7]UHQ19943.1 hypothetical protein LVB87_01935 [Lysobacter sp. KIS68-7]